MKKIILLFITIILIISSQAQIGCLFEMDTILTPMSEPFPVNKSIVANSDGDYWISGGSLPDDSVFFEGQELSGVGDMYVMRFNSNHDLVWEKRGTTGGWFKGWTNSMAVFNNNAVVIGGHFEQSLTFETETLSNINGNVRNPFIAKFDPAGALVWMKRIHTVGLFSTGSITSVVADDLDNVFFGGNFVGTIIIGSDTITSWGGGDNFWGKMNSNGELVWVKAAGGPIGEIGMSIALDELGNMYGFGYNSNSYDSAYIDMDVGIDQTGFIVKYNTNGVQSWVVIPEQGSFWIGQQPIYGGRIKVKNGRVAVLGKIYSNEDSLVQIAGVTYQTESSEAHEVGVLVLDTAGNGLWLNSITTGLQSLGLAIEILDNGHIAAVVEGALSVDNTPLDSAGLVYMSIDGDNGNMLSYCQASQFEYYPLARAMTSYGNNVLVSGIFGHAPLQIGGIFIAKMNTLVTGVEDLTSKENGIKVYPNPASEQLNFETIKRHSVIKQIIIYDLQGRQILTRSFNQGVTGIVSIDFSNLPQGMYILSTTTDNGDVFNTVVACQ